MNEFNSLKEIAKFFDMNYIHFLRYEDHTVDYNGTTYLLEPSPDAPVPMVRIGYFDDEGDLHLLMAIAELGIVIAQEGENGEDKLQLFEYVDIIHNELFGLSFYDLARFNYILKRAVRDM